MGRLDVQLYTFLISALDEESASHSGRFTPRTYNTNLVWAWTVSVVGLLTSERETILFLCWVPFSSSQILGSHCIDWTSLVLKCKNKIVTLLNWAPRHESVCGGRAITLPFLNSEVEEGGSSARRPSRFIHGERFPAPMGCEDRWSAEPVWKLWCREKYLAFIRNRTPAVQHMTELPDSIILI
jgi:hypothetical protein